MGLSSSPNTLSSPFCPGPVAARGAVDVKKTLSPLLVCGPLLELPSVWHGAFTPVRLVDFLMGNSYITHTMVSHLSLVLNPGSFGLCEFVDSV